MHGYCASVFILPTAIIHDIEQLMCGFLWCQGEMKRGKAKVSWDSVCFPKQEGGLGIAIKKGGLDSMWVRWIHSYKLKGRSFWDVRAHAYICWGWWKILQIRTYIGEFCWVPIGDGKSSAWFDKWDVHCPLMEHLSPRIIARAGFSLQALYCARWYVEMAKCLWRLHAGQFKDFSVGMAWDSIRAHRSALVSYCLVFRMHAPACFSSMARYA
ncbi:hypothetical protein Tco_0441365 [Tanacetum coccineum]